MLGPIGEIILYVEDMPSQVAFYRDTLGLTIAFPRDVDDYRDQGWVLFDAGPCKLALHAGGQKRFGEDAPKFVFMVDDALNVRAMLAERGVPISEVRSPAPGVDVCDARDPEGNAFSIECHG